VCRWCCGLGGQFTRVVGFNFLSSDLDQGFLLPPDMREWLEPDHLVFFVMDAVAQFDLEAFQAEYRLDGRGGAAYDPQLMVGLLLFAYCEGVRSSRQIERRCTRDVAYRILSGNRAPDHATIARFRDRHQAGLRAVFVQVLRLCAEAGLVRWVWSPWMGPSCRLMRRRCRTMTKNGLVRRSATWTSRLRRCWLRRRVRMPPRMWPIKTGPIPVRRRSCGAGSSGWPS
jgi:transposase